MHSVNAATICLTNDGAPEPDPSVLLKDIWTGHTDGSALYVHRFEIQDFDKDGRVDILFLQRDASYSGHFFEILYYPGQIYGFCGMRVVGNLHALNPNVKLHIDSVPGEYPAFIFSFDIIKGKVEQGRKRPVEYQTWKFFFDEKKSTYIKKLIKIQER